MCQIWKGSVLWLLRFEGLKKHCRKTFKCDTNADPFINVNVSDNNSSLNFRTGELKKQQQQTTIIVISINS